MHKLSSILLVDDDGTTNFTNQMLLEDMGVAEKILVAHNGKEAIQVIKQACIDGSCPQLILLDINMPVMNGFEFLSSYKSLDITCNKSVVIVMLTTSLNPKDVDRLKEAPIQDLLNKPLTEAMVQRLLHTHFQRALPG